MSELNGHGDGEPPVEEGRSDKTFFDRGAEFLPADWEHLKGVLADWGSGRDDVCTVYLGTRHSDFLTVAVRPSPHTGPVSALMPDWCDDLNNLVSVLKSVMPLATDKEASTIANSATFTRVYG